MITTTTVRGAINTFITERLNFYKWIKCKDGWGENAEKLKNLALYQHL